MIPCSKLKTLQNLLDRAHGVIFTSEPPNYPNNVYFLKG